jgi:hypothetical protein
VTYTDVERIDRYVSYIFFIPISRSCIEGNKKIGKEAL